MQCAQVIHRRGSDDHQRADDKCAFHVGQGQAKVGLQTSAGLLVELRDLEFLTPEGMDHSNRTQSFLCLGQHGTFLFLDPGRFPPNPLGKEVDRYNQKRNNRERHQSQLPIESYHDSEGANQRDDRSEDPGEAFVVDCLNSLRIVSDAEAGIARPPGVVKFERETLQMGIEISPQFEQRLKADFHEYVVAGEIAKAP